jgi:RND family efflux transporter MFP subunit
MNHTDKPRGLPLPARICLLAPVFAAFAQSPELVAVIARPVSRTAELPGEIQPFLSVALHAKVSAYVERVLVDRGSRVQAGQLLVDLSAPELKARIAAAESKFRAAESDRAQAVAQLAAAQTTLDRLKKAAETPGAIAGIELVQAQKQVEALEALVSARQEAARAAEAAVRAEQEDEAYLRILAPFEGVVTERLVHPGALAGPGNDTALLVLEQLSRLRLIVAVPEEYVAGVAEGMRVLFHVPAYPGRTFAGTVARSAHSLDPKNRTLPVELDVRNTEGALAPGMYPTVAWPVRSPGSALFVPRTAVVTTTERTFVIRPRGVRNEWVDVVKGASEGDLIQVRGDLRAGDLVVKRATDEMR